MKIINAGNIVMNSYVYPISDGYVMIDTGYEHSMSGVEKKLQKQGVSLSDIKYIFLTHAHDDHAGFLNEMLGKYPSLQVILSEKAIPTLQKGQNSFDGGCSTLFAWIFCKLMGLFGKAEHRFPIVEKKYYDRLITITPSNKEQLEGLLQGKIIETPGHTSDSISLKIGDVVFCGDAAMNGLPSSKRFTIWIEDTFAFEKSWETLLGEDVAIIYPAHGNPFAPNDLAKYKSYISKIRLRALK